MTDQGKSGSGFGSCCEELKEVLGAKDFDALVAVGDDGVLYMSIGMLDAEEGEANVIDHPVFFCPFCGTGVQTREEVEAKSGGEAEGS